MSIAVLVSSCIVLETFVGLVSYVCMLLPLLASCLVGFVPVECSAWNMQGHDVWPVGEPAAGMLVGHRGFCEMYAKKCYRGAR